MEYGLRGCRSEEDLRRIWLVLILVLMEYGLRVWPSWLYSDLTDVLILVLMEYGLRGSNL